MLYNISHSHDGTFVSLTSPRQSAYAMQVSPSLFALTESDWGILMFKAVTVKHPGLVRLSLIASSFPPFNQ